MNDKLEVVIAGGGVAGVELALALNDMAPKVTNVRLMAPEPEFELKPMAVAEPFTGELAERHDLRAVMEALGGEFVDGALAEVESHAHRIRYGFDGSLAYDVLVVCTGARVRPAYRGVRTFWSDRSEVAIDELIEAAAGSRAAALTLVVPPVTSWPLPIYELALLARRRAEEIGHAGLKIEIFTPEAAPLGVFGEAAASAIADLLEGRRVTLHLNTHVGQPGGDGPLTVSNQVRRLDPDFVLALPELCGSFIAGLPADRNGFIPLDRFGRVDGVEDVYAAGDGTSFPLKQGGLATQQADAVAEHIAMRLGALASANPFEPVLRGRLLTGGESVSLEHELAGGSDGPGEVSAEALWWPPQKVAGRYLSAWLGQADDTRLQAPEHSLEVEVAWPHEWHAQPL